MGIDAKEQPQNKLVAIAELDVAIQMKGAVLAEGSVPRDNLVLEGGADNFVAEGGADDLKTEGT